MENHYQETVDLYNRVASDYAEKFMDVAVYNTSYDHFCKNLPINAFVFEIGCGPGNITKYLLSKRPDLNIDAIDVATNMIAIAQQNKIAANFSVMDCRDIGTIDKKYDGIIAGFTIPYLSNADCEKLISDVARLLNENGVFYLSFVEGNYSDSGYRWNSPETERYHFFFHERRYLLDCFLKHSLQLSQLFKIDYPEQKELSNHVVLIAKKISK